MHFFDIYCIDLFKPSFYRRFVDDSFMIAKDSKDNLIRGMNSWHGSIKWECSSEQVVNFLDIELSIDEERHVRYQTYIKPQNAHLFVPGSSAHPRSTARSIICGAVKRFAVTNDTYEKFDFHINQFIDRLADRGYRRSQLHKFKNEAIARTTIPSKRSRAARERGDTATRKIFLPVLHSSSLNTHFLKSALNRHKQLIENVVGCVKFCLARSQQANLFRRYFEMNFRHEAWDNHRGSRPTTPL